MRKHSVEESRKFVSNPGSRWYHKKHGEVQPDGTIILVEDEVIDLQEQMNAEYPSTTIENILANSNPQDFFGDDGEHSFDATKIPTTLAEFLQFQIDQKLRFDRLPVEIKQKFDNDLNKFMMSAGTEEWLEKMGFGVQNNNAGIKSSPLQSGSEAASEEK